MPGRVLPGPGVPRIPSSRHATKILERGLGGGTVEVCVEGTAGDLATTVGIGVITCCGKMVSFLAWYGSGQGSCPKLWGVLAFNNNRNIRLKLV